MVRFAILLGLLLLSVRYFPQDIVPSPASPSNPDLHGSTRVVLWGSKWLFFFQCPSLSDRVHAFSHFYHSKPWPSNLQFNYKFVGFLADTGTDPPNLGLPDNLENWRAHPNREQTQWKFRHMSGLFWAFNYTLQETDAEWIYRGDDDVLINFNLLPEYMRELGRAHDPLREVVIRGDCMLNGPTYPQGGAGVLFSRLALERLVPLSRYSIWGFYESCPDQRLGRLMEVLGMDPGVCSSSSFLGTPLSFPDFLRVRDNNFTNLPECPVVALGNRGCRQFVAPLAQYVFFHGGWFPNYERTDIIGRMKVAQNLWNASRQVATVQTGKWTKQICWMKEPLERAFAFL